MPRRARPQIAAFKTVGFAAHSRPFTHAGQNNVNNASAVDRIARFFVTVLSQNV